MCPLTTRPVPSVTSDADGERGDQEAGDRGASHGERVPGDDHERRDPEVRACFGAVAREARRGREKRVAAGPDELRRHDEVEQIAVERRRRVDGLRLEAGCEVVDERSSDERGQADGACERSPDASDARARVAHEPVGEREPDCERKRGRDDDLGRDPELQAEEDAEPPRQAAPVDLGAEVPDRGEGHQRHQEDARHVQVPLLLAEHVAGEPEQVAADERRPRRPRHVAAEQVGSERGERRSERRGQVVRDVGPEERRHRRKDQGEPRNARRPGEIDAGRRVDRVAVERVLPRLDRVQHPRERPDEDLRVAAVADEVAARV